MVRLLLLALAALGLTGCTPWPGKLRDAGPGVLTASHYDFNWQLSGDAAVAPLQVFSGAGHTWLQFAPGRTPPALFAQTPAGLQPLPYSRQDPYIIVDGVWPALVLRGGHQVARADRQAPPAGAGNALPLPAPQEWADTTPAAVSAQADGAAPARSQPLALGTGETAVPSGSPPGTPVYRAGLPDTTLRAVLARWASHAGWLFEPHHWAIDADIPLAGQAEFPGDFKSAVRALLTSTELAERPLQPCFYSNKVLRVVSLAQSCDRSVSLRGQS